MIKLGDVVLPDQLYWEERPSYSPVKATTQRALDGTLYIWEGSIGNQEIDLSLEGPEKALLTYDQLKALQSLASAVNTTYTLIFNNETVNVRFRHEHNPVLDFKSLVLNPAPENIDNSMTRYYGTIKLMEV
ncbi:MAG: hypothetical protein HQK91_15175 [Nitrospirae bacterium]|nr:hypothetical protein [Nitrospirota bacterium]